MNIEEKRKKLQEYRVKNREKQKEYKKKHKDKVREHTRKYQQKNKEKMALYRKAYYDKKKEKIVCIICGSTYQKTSHRIHELSNKHNEALIKKISEENNIVINITDSEIEDMSSNEVITDLNSLMK